MANRPLMFNDYVGQERMKAQLRISIGASIKTGKPLPHILVSGGAGLGKTTVAKIIANEFGVGFHEVMASNLTGVDEVEAVLANLSDDKPDILFIDEIHRLTMRVEELLYPVMEDFIFEREVIGKNGRKETRRFWVPRFTLVGATTLAGDISKPLRDRFGLHFQLRNYSADEISVILKNLSIRENITITNEALYGIANRSKGVARIAVNLFNRCKEYADFIKGDGAIDLAVVESQFQLMNIDEIGLDENDYEVLTYLANQSRPIGLDALATAINIDKNTVANIIEPFLIQQHLIRRTRSGREITEQGFNWLNRKTMLNHDNSATYAERVKNNNDATGRVGSI